MTIRIGTAGWTIPRDAAAAFAAEGSSLERYASRFSAAEINSSFHRSHRASTWAGWHAAVPEDFRFSAKLPKAITHQARLRDCAPLVEAFAAEVAGLGDKLAVLLVQLPPSLEFDAAVAAPFFALLSDHMTAAIACEPRHPSWFDGEPDRLLADWHIARVAADPARVPSAAQPGGWRGLDYWRLHGSPVMYRSSYAGRLKPYAAALTEAAAADREAWCLFDNTASSAATTDALALQATSGAARAPCHR